MAAGRGAPGMMGGGPQSVGGQIPGMPPAMNVRLADIDKSLNCPERFTSFTTSCVPLTSAAEKRSKALFGLVVTPLATKLHNKTLNDLGSNNSNLPDGGAKLTQDPASQEQDDPASRIANSELPVVNFGETNIVRCAKCRAYINPFVKFIENGRRWLCNFCGRPNTVKSSYFCFLGEDGKRKDWRQRPELSCGAVELVAPGEYMVRPPQAPVFFFVIDVSFNAVSTGMLNATIQAIRESLPNLPGGPRTQIGFITYDSTVHFYNLDKNLSAPQMLVISDLNDVFVPLPPDNLLVNLQDSMELVEQLLEMLTEVHAKTQNVECCMGAALSAASLVMSDVGGKILLLASSLPSIGPYRLQQRSVAAQGAVSAASVGPDTDKSMLNPNPSEKSKYTKLAHSLNHNQISVDLFVASLGAGGQRAYADIATLSVIPQYTAGELFFYPEFSHRGNLRREALAADIKKSITKPMGFEAVMRVRASRGIKLQHFMGNFLLRGHDLLALANVNADASFTVLYSSEINDKTTDPSARQGMDIGVACFQSALLYTTSKGERRIRVLTTALPTTNNATDIFNGVNMDTYAKVMANIAVEKAKQRGTQETARYMDFLTKHVINAYERQSNPHGAYGQVHGGMLNAPASRGYPGQPAYGATHYGASGPPGVGGSIGQSPGRGPGGNSKVMKLPTSMQLLPLYTMSLIKSGLLRGSPISYDERASLFALFKTMPISQAKLFLYPKMYSLTTIDWNNTNVGKIVVEDITSKGVASGATTNVANSSNGANNNGTPGKDDNVVHRPDKMQCKLPEPLSLTAAMLRTDAVFLVDAGIAFYLWVGKNVNMGILNSLFGQGAFQSPEHFAQIPCEQIVLVRVQGNVMNERLWGIIDSIRMCRKNFMQVNIVTGDSPIEKQEFFHLLVEDRATFPEGAMTYQEYLMNCQNSSPRANFAAQAGPPR